MTDEINNFESPCIRNCCLNENNICLGCFRSMAEIMAWSHASDEERKVILESVKSRAKELARNFTY